MKEFTKEISTGFSTKILTFAKPVQEIIIKVYDLLKYVYLVKNISEETIHSRVLSKNIRYTRFVFFELL